MKSNPEWQFETKAIHIGSEADPQTGASKVPIYQSAAFKYDDPQEFEDIFHGRKYGSYYSRVSNPTVTALEKKLTALENGVGSICFSSGMAAITAAIFAIAQHGDHIIVSKHLFGSTYYLINGPIKQAGIQASFVDLTDHDAYISAFQTNTKLVFAEAIGNPSLHIINLETIVKTAKNNNVPTIIDNTFLTPYLLNSKSFGIAAVVSSTTKYMCGGGSSIGGSITDLGNFTWTNIESTPLSLMSRFGTMAFLSSARKVRSTMGACLAPFNAYLTLFGIETLPLRMDKHCYNAYHLAKHLSTLPMVRSVSCPSLETNPFYPLAKKQFLDGKTGGMLNFRLGSKKTVYQFIKEVRLASNLVNLGDSKTLIVQPESTIYRNLSAEEKIEADVYDDMVRVSVGLENINDIIYDFENALSSISLGASS